MRIGGTHNVTNLCNIVSNVIDGAITPGTVVGTCADLAACLTVRLCIILRAGGRRGPGAAETRPPPTDLSGAARTSPVSTQSPGPAASRRDASPGRAVPTGAVAAALVEASGDTTVVWCDVTYSQGTAGW